MRVEAKYSKEPYNEAVQKNSNSIKLLEYNGNNEDLYGTVTISDTGWYVLERVDKNTVMILYK